MYKQFYSYKCPWRRHRLLPNFFYPLAETNSLYLMANGCLKQSISNIIPIIIWSQNHCSQLWVATRAIYIYILCMCVYVQTILILNGCSSWLKCISCRGVKPNQFGSNWFLTGPSHFLLTINKPASFIPVKVTWIKRHLAYQN